MNKKEHLLVVGTGSIAKRHVRNLKLLFPEACVCCAAPRKESLSLDNVKADRLFQEITDAVSLKPKFAIVASPAPLHLNHASLLLKKDIPVLIEKPLCADFHEYTKYKSILMEKISILRVGYCMRYHPLIIKTKDLIQNKTLGKLSSSLIDVGQYLPDWREGINYKNTVSANKSLGGGVLLELSHELDYLHWFFGEFTNVSCNILNTGLLDIDVEDSIDAILSRSDNFTVNLHLDFLQRKPTRSIKLIGEKGVLICDLLENTITLHGPNNLKEILFSEPSYNTNDMYLDMLKSFTGIIPEKKDEFNEFKSSVVVMGMIDSMRQAHKMNNTVQIKSINL